MSGPELDLGPGLRDACEGRPPGNAAWEVEYDLAGMLNGGKSGNWGPMAEATKLREFGRRRLPLTDPSVRRCIENWDAYYKASARTFMGDEFGTGVIYSLWHFLPNLAVADWCSRHFPANAAPWLWLHRYWTMVQRLLCPDGRILKIGQRAGGHPPLPGLLELFYAMAVGVPDLSQEVAWCKAAGIPLRAHGGHSAAWEEDAAVALKPALQKSIGWQLPDGAFVNPWVAVPFHVRHAPNGEVCAWIERTGNQNTTAVLGATWNPVHGAQYLPPNGGARIRQNNEHAVCGPEGAFLVYQSNLQGQHSLPLSPALVAAPTASWEAL